MKTSRKNLLNQRQIMDQKLKAWELIHQDRIPQTGWIRAIRGALGITTRQLAKKLGVDHATVRRLEEREVKGKASLETINKVAQAMNCQLVYALIPKAPFVDLESIVDERAKNLASSILKKVSHSMRLEKQGAKESDTQKQIERLAYDLKLKGDKRIWDSSTKGKKDK